MLLEISDAWPAGAKDPHDGDPVSASVRSFSASSWTRAVKGELMPMRPLPRNPNLKLINEEAKHLLQDFHQGRAPAVARYLDFDPLPDTLNPRLSDARNVIAREYGYTSWPKLRQHLDDVAHDSEDIEELVGL
jgi:hypothetical protein